jgi:hypothetical protein
MKETEILREKNLSEKEIERLLSSLRDTIIKIKETKQKKQSSSGWIKKPTDSKKAEEEIHQLDYFVPQRDDSNFITKLRLYKKYETSLAENLEDFFFIFSKETEELDYLENFDLPSDLKKEVANHIIIGTTFENKVRVFKKLLQYVPLSSETSLHLFFLFNKDKPSSLETKEVISQEIDLSGDNFNENVLFLNFLSERKTKEVAEVLESKGIFLEHNYVLMQIAHVKTQEEEKINIEPSYFLFDKNKIAKTEGDFLKIYSPEDFEKSREDIENLQLLHKELSSLKAKREKLSFFYFHTALFELEEYQEMKFNGDDLSGYNDDNLLNREEQTWKEIERLEREIIATSLEIEEIEKRVGTLEYQETEIRNLFPDYMKGENFEADLVTYKFFLENRSLIEKAFSIDIFDKPLFEQFQFIRFIKEVSCGMCREVSRFIILTEDWGFKAFLSIADGNPDFAKRIIEVHHKNILLFEPVLKKYAEIVDIVADLENYLLENLSEQEVTPEILQEIQQNLLKYGKGILSHFLSRFEKGEVTFSEDAEEIEKELEKVKTDVLALTTTLRALHKRGEIAINKFKRIRRETIDSKKISHKDRQRMVAIYKSNYEVTPNAKGDLVKDFEKIISPNYEGEAEVHVVYLDDEVVGFFVLVSDPNNPHIKDAKAFNIDDQMKSSKIGEEMMQTVFDTQAKENVLKGTANGDISVTSNYIERGFIATEVDSFYEISHAIKIVRNDGKNNLFRTKAKNPNSSEKMSLERIQREVLTDENIQVFEREKMTDHDYSLLNQESRSSDSEKVWVLTRSIIDEETKKTFLVYERVSRDDLADYLQI